MGPEYVVAHNILGDRRHVTGLRLVFDIDFHNRPPGRPDGARRGGIRRDLD